MLKLLVPLARREHDSDRLCGKSTGDEGQRERGCLVEPLRVIDCTQQRALLGDIREQAQDPQPNEESVRGRAAAPAEDNLERPALRGWESREPTEQRSAELMQ